MDTMNNKIEIWNLRTKCSYVYFICEDTLAASLNMPLSTV